MLSSKKIDLYRDFAASLDRGGSRPQTDKNCRKVPLQVNFLDADILLWCL
jgi:hypothetical protein